MLIEKKIEIVSSSTEGLKKAVTEGVLQANKNIGKVCSAEVSNIVAVVNDGHVVDWKIKMIVTYN